MELKIKGDTRPVATLTIEEAIRCELIALSQECASREEATDQTAKATAKALALLVDLLHARKHLIDDDVLALLPHYEKAGPPWKE